MADGNRWINPRKQFLDGNGDPLAGAKLYTYITGTTTPKVTYSDQALTTPNANPVVSDADGYFGDIWLATDVAYKLVLNDSADVLVWSADPVDGAFVADGSITSDKLASGLDINVNSVQFVTSPGILEPDQ
jgi:hypothetical protein